MPYVRMFVSGFKQRIVNDLGSVLTCFLGVSLVSVIVARTKGVLGHPYSHLNIVMFVSIIVRFTLFPQVSDRFLAVQYIIIGITLLVLVQTTGVRRDSAVEVQKTTG